MDFADSCAQKPASATAKSTNLLCGVSTQLNLTVIHSLVAKDFALKDVQKMIASSDLYSNRLVLSRILGEPDGRVPSSRSGATRLSCQ